MKLRWIALVLALLLLAALPALAETRLPDCFQMEEVIRLYNDQLVQSFLAVKPTETATKVSLYRTYGMTTEGNEYRFGNQDYSVALSATFPDGDMSLSYPPAVLEFTVANSINLLDAPVIKSAFAGMIARADSSADQKTVQDWITGATKDGETLPMNGYTLTHTRGSGGHTYTLAAEAQKGIVATPEPVATPKPVATPRPTARPVQEPGSGPDIITEPDPTQAPPVEAGTLLSWKGFELTPLRTERWRFANGRLSLRVYLSIANQTGQKLSLRAEDVTVDGTALPTGYLFDIKNGYVSGPDSEDNLLFYPDGNITDALSKAILYGKEMTMKIVLQDTRKHEDLYMEKVTLDLSALPDETTIAELTATPAPTPKPTPKPTKAPAKSSYQPLFEGDKGEDVRRMQRKLIDLGYLNDTADGSYGPRTAAAVREFCETNGLGSASYASSAMLEKLYSGSAKAYQEPWVPLVFQEGARGEWQNAKSNQLSFRAKVTNTSRTRTVKAFEFYMYATDVWGDKIYGSSIYYGTSSKTIKPGQSAFSDYFLLPNRSQISKVWCGVKKVIFSDGTVRENSTVDYDSWTIK